MVDDLRERLADYLSRMELPRAILVDGVVKIITDDMADALLPFIRAEIVAELEWLLGSPTASLPSSWATTVLGRVQIRLQQLHDGVSHERKAP